MDMETMRRLEREADERDQTLAVLEHLKRRAERRRFWAFCFSWKQVVDEPTVTEPISGASASVSGVGPGAADSEPISQPPVTTQGPGGAHRFVGPAGPTTPTVRPVRGAGPATPHLHPSEASRISARITRT